MVTALDDEDLQRRLDDLDKLNQEVAGDDDDEEILDGEENDNENENADGAEEDEPEEEQ